MPALTSRAEMDDLVKMIVPLPMLQNNEFSVILPMYQ
jgi:hypothetical protein